MVSNYAPINTPNFIDLFAGCGGLSLGLEQAGFSPVFVNEIDNDALETYLINRDQSFPYLRNPKFDPHGEAIPNSAGRFTLRNQSSLVSLSKYDRAVVVGVRNHSPDFLRYLSSSGMTIGSQIEVTRRFDFDYSMEIQVGGKTKIVLPAKHSTEIYVRKI